MLALDKHEVNQQTLAVNAASASLALSEVPFPKPVAAVRVGYVPVDGEDGGAGDTRVLVVNPSAEQLKASSLDLLIAGTSEAVLMIEGFCDFLPEETLIEAIEEGLAAVRTIALAISDWAETCARPTYEAGIRVPLPGVDAKVSEIVADRIEASLTGPSKDSREDWEELCKEAVGILTDPEAETVYEKADVKGAFKRLASETLRRMGARGVRQDGRSTTEVRPIDIQMRPLPPQARHSSGRLWWGWEAGKAW